VFQVRIHGRGGQGVVTAAELLSVAAFLEGRHAQAFPSFGSERTGAPVVSFCRFGPSPVRTREPVTAPDAVIVQDATLLRQVDVFAGLRRDGYVLLNSSCDPRDLALGPAVAELPADHVRSVPATELARTIVGRPLPNVALLGAFAALTGQLSLQSVLRTAAERFAGPLGQANGAAAAEAYRLIRPAREALTRAATA
jgi:pyruvate ferredoxin oxidoreductase gamma subunit